MTDKQETVSIKKRRKSVQIKRRRKREIFRKSLLLTAAVAALSLIGNGVAHHVSSGREVAKQGDITVVDEGAPAMDAPREEDRLQAIREKAQAGQYPEEIIQLLDKNSETAEFVENYGEKKDAPPAQTVADTLTPGQIPHLLQWDERWGYQSYGTSTIAASGCGPTCMSMVIAGLTGDVTATPYVLAKYSEQNGYVDESNNTYWKFLNQAGANWGISITESGRDDALIVESLLAGHPVICSVGPGDFTSAGHFIVLTGYDNGNVEVKDPFSIKNTQKSWIYTEIADQINEVWICAGE